MDSLTKLTSLNAAGCSELHNFPGLSKLIALEKLSLGGKLKQLPSLDALTKLTSLDAAGCHELQSLPELDKLPSLRHVSFSVCPNKSVEILAIHCDLESINLEGCGKIESFEPIRKHLDSLKLLSIYGCEFNDLPIELSGSHDNRNVIQQVRAHLSLIHI